MNREDVRAAIVAEVERIAPNTKGMAWDAKQSLRDQAELDSMDFLRFVEAVHRVFGIEVPERDYARVDSLAGCTDYVLARCATPSAGVGP